MSTPLGEFLRVRRDATRPEALGLPAGTRRRAPGLRRSELATLAGISVEYLIRIEQGRDRNLSPSVVNALAEALRLDVAEREHLRYLVKIASGVCAGSLAQPRQEVRPAVLQLLDQLEPGIALVTNRLGDVLAYTTGFELIARPVGLLDTDSPNLTRFVFTDERAREAFRTGIASRTNEPSICGSARPSNARRSSRRSSPRSPATSSPGDCTATFSRPATGCGGGIRRVVSSGFTVRSWSSRPATPSNSSCSCPPTTPPPRR